MHQDLSKADQEFFMQTVAVIGGLLRGLPLVIEFGKHSRTIGFDIATNKVESCLRGLIPRGDPG